MIDFATYENELLKQIIITKKSNNIYYIEKIFLNKIIRN